MLRCWQTMTGRRLGSVAVAVVVMAVLSFGTAPSAQAAEPFADRPNFQLPYACGTTYTNSTYPGHGDYEIDMIMGTGTPVLASAAGTAYRGFSTSGGYQVSILHGNGWRTLYLHLQAGSYQFSDGQFVRQGQVVARSDDTGTSSSGPHLHFEQQLWNGSRYAPVHAYFNGVPSQITDDALANSERLTSANCGTRVVMSGDSLLYRALRDGRLMAYNHLGWASATAEWSYWGQIGTGWDMFKFVLADGLTLYGITQTGELKWYHYNGDGTWSSGCCGKVIGTGWDMFKQVFSGGGGVLYGITYDGQLKWYRYTDPVGGNGTWVQGSGKVIGTGWLDFVHVFADADIFGGSGAIYAVTRNGDLKWYRYTDPLSGNGDWSPSGCCGRVIGNDWSFPVLGSGSLGVIYGVRYNGALYWYKHLDPMGGASSWRYSSGVQVGSDWSTQTERSHPPRFPPGPAIRWAGVIARTLGHGGVARTAELAALGPDRFIRRHRTRPPDRPYGRTADAPVHRRSPAVPACGAGCADRLRHPRGSQETAPIAAVLSVTLGGSTRGSSQLAPYHSAGSAMGEAGVIAEKRRVLAPGSVQKPCSEGAVELPPGVVRRRGTDAQAVGLQDADCDAEQERRLGFAAAVGVDADGVGDGRGVGAGELPILRQGRCS